jgi:hypothetical protein
VKSRREVILGYVEFIAAAKVLGFGYLVKGEAPSIERMMKAHNRKPIRKGKAQTITELPYPPLPDMIAAKVQEFERGRVPSELQERARAWAERKREELGA